VPDGITGIGHGAFSDCKNLVTLDISDSVAIIGDIDVFDSVPMVMLMDCMFSNCENLKTVCLPRKSSILAEAFLYTQAKVVYKD
jgi:hypothetical protein